MSCLDLDPDLTWGQDDFLKQDEKLSEQGVTATAIASLQENKKAIKSLGDALDTSKTNKMMLQQPPG